ncbi:M56 family metallopeptidase [Streptacidiphilus sp. EB103A]|uniref:M56 family metallopeptidase n=1 Tax=Streptacidiphilus sp. EB103A TaxID=3156275 RepID=UPI0035131A3B
MIVSALLLGYVVFAPRWLVRALRGAAWTGRAPQLATAAWICLACSLLCATVFAGIAPLVPMLFPAPPGAPGASAAGAELLVGLWPDGHPFAIGRAVLLGLVAAAALVLRIVIGFAVAGYRTRRQSDRHEEIVSVVGRRMDGIEPALVVVEHSDPAAYCLPGKGSRIIVTSGALRTLSDGQLHAVLAHERAHLRGRHHLIATFAHAVAALVPRSQVLDAIRSELLRLLELLADDAAARTADRLDLAEALLTLASAPHTAPIPARAPGIALAAVGKDAAGYAPAAESAAAQRVRRLLQPRSPLGAGRTAGAGLAIITMALTPPLLLLGPALVACCAAYCTSLTALQGLLVH